MKVQIQSIHFDADKKLLAFIQDKVEKLNQFHDGIIEGNVFLRIEKNDTAENKVAEIKLRVTGQDLFAKRNCQTFEEAIDTSIDALTKQLKKHKEKLKGI
ncbi:MAG: ribosome-associated translation inhibitor RaiA [Bacteroidia bacterium]|nr:ribosome-associated translation inhibitor RaiA [Bacteroidia bacterium]MCZ2247498.1 ribosome-associated translation inhibitor RaiA [Bacteroidia bacterium]